MFSLGILTARVTMIARLLREEADLDGVPDGVRERIARCLAKEPGDRPTPDELLADLTEEEVAQATALLSSGDWLPPSISLETLKRAQLVLELEGPPLGDAPSVEETSAGAAPAPATDGVATESVAVDDETAEPRGDPDPAPPARPRSSWPGGGWADDESPLRTGTVPVGAEPPPLPRLPRRRRWPSVLLGGLFRRRRQR